MNLLYIFLLFIKKIFLIFMNLLNILYQFILFVFFVNFFILCLCRGHILWINDPVQVVEKTGKIVNLISKENKIINEKDI
jgi:hypothetical protein